jgi:hypothetical protein
MQRREENELRRGRAAAALWYRRWENGGWYIGWEDGGWYIGWGRYGKCGRGGVRGSQGFRNLSDGGGVRGPTQRGISQGGDLTGLEVGSGWVEVALTGCQAMGWPHLNNTAEIKVGVVEDPPDQVHAIESGGGTGG